MLNIKLYMRSPSPKSLTSLTLGSLRKLCSRKSYVAPQIEKFFALCNVEGPSGNNVDNGLRLSNGSTICEPIKCDTTNKICWLTGSATVPTSGTGVALTSN